MMQSLPWNWPGVMALKSPGIPDRKRDGMGELANWETSKHKVFSGSVIVMATGLNAIWAEESN